MVELSKVLESAYKVSPSVYYNNSNKLRVISYYTIDDFTQDAVLHIYKLYMQNYIKEESSTVDNLDGLVYKLLDKYFVYNLSKGFYTKKESINSLAVTQDYFEETTDKNSTFITDDSLDTFLDDSYSIKGKKVFNDLVDRLPMRLLRKTNNTCVYENKTYKLTYRDIILLYKKYLSLVDITKLFNENYVPSEYSFIKRKYKEAIEILKVMYYRLDKKDKELLNIYFKSLF